VLDSREEQEFLRFFIASRPALEPTEPPLQWLKGEFYPGVKRSGSEVDHSPPSSTDVKNGGITSQPPPLHGSSWHGA
jgi:hypothetical protein